MDFKINIFKHRLFLVFLLIALVMWGVNKLGYRYKADVDIPIEVTFDYNSFGWIENPQMTINCLVEALGSEILKYKLGLNDAVHIPVSSLMLTKEGADNFSIQPTSLKEALMVVQNRVSVYHILDTIGWLKVIPMISRTLPIKSNIKVDCEKQYMIEGRVKIQPSEITIRAPRSVLDTLKYIETERVVLTNQNKSLSETASLLIPQWVISPQTSIRYSADITGYTELEYILDIEARNLPANISMISAPSQVMVLIKVPLKSFDYNEIDKPVATIDYDDRDTRKNHLYRVSISKLPPGGEVTLIRPEYVEPFFTKN